MEATTDHHEKCMMLHVQIVVNKHKFHSNQMANDLFTVKNATENENQEDIKLLISLNHS